MGPRLIVGTTLKPQLELRLVGSDHHQDNPADKRRAAQKRGERDGLLGVGVGMNGQPAN